MTDFQPRYNEAQLKGYLDMYAKQPFLFSNEHVDELQKHAEHYGAKFDRDIMAGEASINSVVKNLVGGWLSGFSTIPLKADPDNSIDSIARQVGHLAGFVGYLPVRGTGTVANAVRALKHKSIPMQVGGFATQKASKVADNILTHGIKAENKAIKTASEFLGRDTPRGIARSAFNLATASATGEVWHGVDAMMSAFVHGGIAGGAFRGIAEFINFGGTPSFSARFRSDYGQWVKTGFIDTVKNMTPAQRTTLVARSVAGSLFDGLQYTAMGAPVEEQIYHYLLGAWFGFHEQPTKEQKRNKALFDIMVEADSKPSASQHIMLDPESYSKEFNKLDPEIKESVRREWEETHGSPAVQVAIRYGMLVKDPSQQEFLESLGHDTAEAVEKGSRMQNVERMSPKERDKLAQSYVERMYESDEAGIREIIADPEYQMLEPLVLGKIRAVTQDANIPADNVKKRTMQGIEDIYDKVRIENADIDLQVDSIQNADNNERTVWIANSLRTQIKRQLKDYYMSIEQDKRSDAVIDAGRAVGSKLGEAIDNQTLDITPAVKEIEKRSGKTMPEADKQELKRWLITQTVGKNTGVIAADFTSGDDPTLKYSDPSSPRKPLSVFGNDISRREPSKPIEDVVIELLGAEYNPNDPAYRVLERVVVPVMRGNKVVRSEMTLDGALETLNRSELQLEALGSRRDFDSNQSVQERYNRIQDEVITPIREGFARTNQELADKGYYYFGGRGDSHQWYVAKFHPSVEKMNQRDLDVLYEDIATRSGDKEQFKRIMDNGLKDIEMSGISPEQMKRMVASNLMYEMSLNGLTPEIRGNGLMEGRTATAVEGFLKGFEKADFIKNVVAFNKRMQIWFNSGVPTPEGVIEGNTIRYMIVPDAGHGKGKPKSNTPASEQAEASDGAILMERNALNALLTGMGMDASTGFNKSFIVSRDPRYGSLLGKYAIHDAGDAQSRAMREMGVTMLIPESAAKQRGLRKMAKNIKWSKAKQKFNVTEGEIYEMPASDLRTVMTELNTNHMMQDQRVAKQMLSNLVLNGFNRIPQEIMDKVMDEISGKRFRGEETYNQQVAELMADPTNDKLRKGLVENIEKIGLTELFEAIQTNGMEKFAVQAYGQILRLSKSLINDMYREGEVETGEYNEQMAELQEASSIHERMFNALGRNGSPEEYLAILNHKLVDKYRTQAVKNYLVNNLAKPKIGNSFSARMIPFDWELQQRDDVKLDKETFYLGRQYEDLRVRLRDENGDLGRTRTMKDIWQEYQQASGGRKKYLAEQLQTVVMRVPMDSVSGARKLKFGGFVDRQNNGILIHPEVMRALGGADLDGDKAIAYVGLPDYWADIYEGSKKEFLRKDSKGKEYVWDNKDSNFTAGPFRDKTPRELLSKEFKNEQDEADFYSRSNMYSPAGRAGVSLAATRGRQQLGPAVVTKAMMGAMHSGLEERGEYRTVIDGKEVVVTPRKDLTYARELGAATIAFGSDPLDVAGLKSSDLFFKTMFDAHFKVSEVLSNGKLHELSSKKVLEMDTKSIRALGYQQYAEVNSALFGRNHAENRKWTYEEVKRKLQGVASGRVPSNTPVMKQGQLVASIDFYDGPLRRVQYQKFFDTVREFNERVEADPEFIKAMGRTSMVISEMTPLKIILRNNAWSPNGMRELVQTNHEDMTYLVNVAQKQLKSPLFRFLRENHAQEWTRREVANMEWHQKFLIAREYLKKAPDFLSNDLTAMASYDSLKYYFGKIAPERFKSIIKVADDLKSKYAGIYKEIKSERPIDRARDEAGETRELRNTSESIETVEQDILHAVRKARLNREERNLLDMALLSSLRQGDDTSSHAFGYRTNIVRNASIKRFLKNYAKYFSSSRSLPEQIKVSNEVQEGARKELAKEIVYDEVGVMKNADLGEPLIADTAGIRKVIKDFRANEDTIEMGEKMSNELNKFQEFVNFYGGVLKGSRLALFARGIVGKDVDALTLNDLVVMNRVLRKIKDGTLYRRWVDPIEEKDAGELPELRKIETMLFPETINDNLMRRGFKLSETEGAFMTSSGWQMGKVGRPTFWMESLLNTVSYMNQTANGFEKILERETDAMFSPLRGIAGKKATFEKLYQYAVAERGLKYARHLMKTLANKDKATKAQAQIAIQEETATMERVRKEINWDALSKEQFRDGNKSLSAQDLVNRINDVITNRAERMYEILTGAPDILNKYQEGVFEGSDIPRYNIRNFIQDMQKKIKRNEDVSTAFGHDNVLKLLHSMNMEAARELGGKEYEEMLLSFQPRATDKIPFDMYYPHLDHARRQALESLERSRKLIDENTEMTDEQKVNEIASIEMKQKRILGRYSENFDEIETAELHDEIIHKLKEKQDITDGLSRLSKMPRAGSSYSRRGYMGGWSTMPESLLQYQRDIVHTYYRQLSHLMGRALIGAFEKTYQGKANMPEWGTFMKLYLNGALGYPTTLPDALLNDPKMKLRGTPYGWWADNRVADMVNKVYDKLKLPRNKKIPEELNKFDWQNIRSWSNMEAMYQLSTLLAHPKAAVANILSGSSHTLINAGGRAFRNASNFKYIKETIGRDTNWTAMEDVNKWAMSKGVLAEFIAYEIGFGTGKTAEGVRRFSKDLAKKLSDDPEAPMESLVELASKHGLTDSMKEKAAVFMREPERYLRTRSFIAHYLQAYENFQGAIPDPLNSPILLEMARRGVKATQFMYNAPERPMFATSGLGKVMTRFQLWGWNSVRFRKDLIQDANKVGFREGTPEFARYKRLMTADVLTMALANFFMYSIFETALPAPWNWFQDTADWLFGDEAEKSRAFYGMYPAPLAPAQMITPPIARIGKGFFDVMNGAIARDWEKMATYNVYTMFPFGRIVRDLFGPRGLIDNPSWGGVAYKKAGFTNL